MQEFFFLVEAICFDQGSANLFIEGQIVSILDFVVHSAAVGSTVGSTVVMGKQPETVHE